MSLLPREVEVVIYHDPCIDGMASASIIYEYKIHNCPEITVDNNHPLIMYPTSYNKPIPNDELIKGKNVLICDFSYSKEVVLHMIEICNKLLIIDHHKTAQKDLENIPNINKIFDMNHSGASLIWMWIYPTRPIPSFIQYVEDNDIWLKEQEYSDEFIAWFEMEEKSLENYSKFYDDEYFMECLRFNGVGSLTKDNYYISQALSKVSFKFQQITISKNNTKCFMIAYINTSVLTSRIGNEIIKKYPNIDFVALYVTTYNSTYFSLRSTDKNYDCSEIAKIFNGGGHRNASGLTLPYITNVLPGLQYDSNIYNKLQHMIRHNIYSIENDIDIFEVYTDNNKNIIGEYLINLKYYDRELIKPQHIILWHYDGIGDKSYYKITFAKDILSNIFLTIKNQYGLDDNNELVVDGFYPPINLNKLLNNSNTVKI